MTIDETGQAIVNVRNRTVPFTVALTGAGAKTIEVSMNGTDFASVTLDFETPNCVALALLAPVASLRLTAAAGSTWELL